MNPYEHYPYSSRLKDRISEVFGIKQDDGTTSVLQNDIDKLTFLRSRYNNEVNRYVMQVAFTRKNFMDRQTQYEELVKVRFDNNGNRILPYGLNIKSAYIEYRKQKGNNAVFNEQEFNNIYSNLIGLYQTEQAIIELDRKINMYQDYQKRR